MRNSFTFTATGQALIKRDLRPYMGNDRLAEVIQKIKKADFSFTNFEGTIKGSFGGWPTKNKAIAASAPHVLDSLSEMGFNMLSLCNNHAFDLGPGGILSTLEQSSSKEFLHAGIGTNRSDAAKPKYKETSLGRVALIAADCGPQPDYAYALDGNELISSRPGNNRLLVQRNGVGQLEAHPEDTAHHLAMIAEAAGEADFVVVYLHSHHWEPVMEETPTWIQPYAKACIDAGANSIVCHGTPLLQGVEIYKQRPIFYGLGNFVFHTYQPARWMGQIGIKAWQSVIATCSFGEDGNLTEMQFEPILVGGNPDELTNGRYTHLDAPSLADAKQGEEILGHLAQLSLPFQTSIYMEQGVGKAVIHNG
ncbi:capsule biosynthesis protein CapA [Paenibacillus sp. LMG 31456]|uniref:Capsule biosynthesis protein CapA n=1 Tax=Paenibacillus foliorum TaxID=2654974 RepID=A0A972GW88_9BACL|nr:CapA family protein [Paenibacillus foliorum]NOU91696.1 capsule biosynthesis protein CapA [Paenibacillus foliorum]